MDAMFWLIGACIVTVLLIAIPLFQKWFTRNDRQDQPVPVNVDDDAVVVGRARRRRIENEEIERPDHDDEELDKKIGTKKRKKLAEKAEKKALREQEQLLREEEKKREALRYEEQKKQEAEEEALIKRKEEEERERKRMKEKEEHEEYLKLKADFIVEEEGCIEEGFNDTSLTEFIQYIKNCKVVFMEELAGEFNLKTQVVIDRIHSLQMSGELTGVIDDRGKFIYITVEEMKSIAKFIKQRGRVSLTELAESSNSLIQQQ